MENKFKLGEEVMFFDGNDVNGPFKIVHLFKSGAVEIGEDDDNSFVVRPGACIFYEEDKIPFFTHLAKGYLREATTDDIEEIVAYNDNPDDDERGYEVYTHDSLEDLASYEMFFLDDENQMSYKEIIKWFNGTFGYYGDDSLYYHPDTNKYSWVSYF